MEIKIEFNNCNINEAHPDPYSIEGEVKFQITFPKSIPTVQSRNAVREEMKTLIQNELAKISWLAYGPVWLDLVWYLDSTDRQELDSSGDLDNITKQLIDSLTGLKGIFVDDSQMKSLSTVWMMKNTAIPHNLLTLSICFLNDETVKKAKLCFVQYSNAMCFVAELDPTIEIELKEIRLFAEAKRELRTRSAKFMNEQGKDVRAILVGSQKDFHITRLRNIPQERKIRLDDYNNY